MRRTDRYRYPIIMTLLVVLAVHGTQPSGWRSRRARFPAAGAAHLHDPGGAGKKRRGGFLLGLLRDALTPASFGAGALAHTLVGFMSSWAKAVFFAEHVFVKGCLFFAGTWLRNVIVLLVSAGYRARRSRGSCWSGLRYRA